MITNTLDETLINYIKYQIGQDLAQYLPKTMAVLDAKLATSLMPVTPEDIEERKILSTSVSTLKEGTNSID